VNRHISVNCHDYDGRTPLHLSIAENRKAVTEYLLNHGAKVDAKDRWGKTPLDEVTDKTTDDVKEVLKKHGH